MCEVEHATALAEAIEGFEDVCLGPTDIAFVVKALRTLAATIIALTAPADPEPA